MSILPNQVQEFAQKKYWDNFFTKRDKSFEWYGQYEDFKAVLLKYIKPDDRLLVVGCGSSTLSIDLYDDGFTNNTSIDISQVVIQKMIAEYTSNGIRSNLKFETMDVFDMDYPDQSFTVLLDKGTLDALSSDQSLDYDKLFTEIDRVLKVFGRYVCISLLQENIASNLLNWFAKKENWLVRIHLCNIHSNDNNNGMQKDFVDFPVFIVSLTKLKSALPGSFSRFEIDVDSNKNFQKPGSVEDVLKIIKSLQEIEFLKYFVRTNRIQDENFSIKLYDEHSSVDWKYCLYFAQKGTVKETRAAVFIVPQGREHEWLFSTNAGRDNLLKQCQVDRLVVVHLNRVHCYDNLEQIKTELAPQIKNYFPISCPKITFLSIGEDIGTRKLVYQGTSGFSGDFFVEDVTINNEDFRRLVFLTNRNIIQSEAKLKTMKSKKKTVSVLDHKYLCCEHHQIIVAGLALLDLHEQTTINILLVGLGGGCLVNFLRNNLKLKNLELKIVVVEIDETMYEVAQKWFDFQSSSSNRVQVEVVIDDGLEFIRNKASDGQFDFIIFDVDCKNAQLGVSCPPEEFVDESFLSIVKSRLTLNGIFALNLVARNENIKKDVYSRLNSQFTTCWQLSIECDLNEIIFCFNSTGPNQTARKTLKWFQMKQSNQKLKYLQSSELYIELLRECYNDFASKKQILLS